MNCMHCHLYHLYDIGIRVKINKINKNIIIGNGIGIKQNILMRRMQICHILSKKKGKQ